MTPKDAEIIVILASEVHDRMTDLHDKDLEDGREDLPQIIEVSTDPGLDTVRVSMSDYTRYEITIRQIDDGTYPAPDHNGPGWDIR